MGYGKQRSMCNFHLDLYANKKNPAGTATILMPTNRERLCRCQGRMWWLTNGFYRTIFWFEIIPICHFPIQGITRTVRADWALRDGLGVDPRRLRHTQAGLFFSLFLPIMALPNSVYPNVCDDKNIPSLLYKLTHATGEYSNILSSLVTSLFYQSFIHFESWQLSPLTIWSCTSIQSPRIHRGCQPSPMEHLRFRHMSPLPWFDPPLVPPVQLPSCLPFPFLLVKKIGLSSLISIWVRRKSTLNLVTPINTQELHLSIPIPKRNMTCATSRLTRMDIKIVRVISLGIRYWDE